MSAITNNLNLVLPENDEFYDQWGDILNANFNKIDKTVGAVLEEISQARGTTPSIKARLDRGSESNGDLKPSPEVAKARSSSVYGYANGNAEFDLDQRIENSEQEILRARQGLASLEDALSWVNTNAANTVNSAPSNYLTYSGPDITVNTSTPVVMNINGFRHLQVPTKVVTVSGPANTYYLYAHKSEGQIVTSNPLSKGQTSVFGLSTRISQFSATSVNFVTVGVKPGHVLNITGPVGNANVGKYIVLETNTENVDLPPNTLRIVGEFPSALTDLEYEVIDSIQPSYSFSTVAPSKFYTQMDSKIPLASFNFDGTNITSLKAFALNGKFESWYPASLSSGFFTATIEHNLGYIPKQVLIYASQASDFSAPLELISAADAAGSGVTTQRGFLVRVTDKIIEIKNATTGILYKDFDGVTQTSGHVFVSVER